MYTAQLDVSSEPTHSEVQQFAKEHGCTANLLIINGPAGGNPLYQFSSNNYDHLEELVGQILGRLDPEHIKTIINEI
jgi:hypothetical protein